MRCGGELRAMRLRRLVILLLVVDFAAAALVVQLRTGPADVVIGRPPATTQQPRPGATIVVERASPPVTAGAPAAAAVVAADPPPVPLRPRPEVGRSRRLRTPDAEQYGAAIEFRSDEAVPEDLLFVLVIGSDARPGERLERSRGDSIHLLAVNPRSGTGTVLGFPRDTWTEIPGHGRGKINAALALGGPDLLSETVRRLTGLPVHWWVLTGFDGLRGMVDDLGRLVVPVARRMADRASGAYFDRGLHSMSGREVLAFTRDRHTVARGDFSRSENQGTVILQALRKMRVEVSDTAGVRRWVGVLLRHGRVEAGMDDLVRLGATARRLDPERLRNVVAPGKVGKAGRASVVYLTEDAARLFADLRDDATIGRAPAPTTTTAPAPTPTTTPVATTSTTAPPSLLPTPRPRRPSRRRRRGAGTPLRRFRTPH